MVQVTFEGARGVLLLGLLGQMLDSNLVVADDEPYKIINSAEVHLKMLVNVATSGF